MNQSSVGGTTGYVSGLTYGGSVHTHTDGPAVLEDGTPHRTGPTGPVTNVTGPACHTEGTPAVVDA